MNSPSLSTTIRHALAAYGDRTVIEAMGGQWHLTGAQLLRDAASLSRAFDLRAGRPLIAYLRKSPLSYAFTACAFLNRLDFCPLDIENPTERVLDVASQLADSLILCDDDDLFARLRDRTERCLKIGLPLDPIPDATPAKEADDGSCDARYYIATSGSTGRPKLVAVPHDRTIPFIDWAVPFYGIGPSTRWAQFSSIGFDLSLVDFLSVVCGGGMLVSISSQMDRIRPARTVQQGGITHWHSVPSMIPYFLREATGEEGISTCRLFTFCGEPLMKTDADRLAGRYPHARIINTYGPTEGTLFCSFFEYVPGDASVTESSLPIGQPIPSWNFVLLPEDGALRLVILSDNVASGYAGVHSPQFATVELFGREIRAFDTGDYFRMVGTHLYFSHRKDAMVKIHGNRVDLGELEAAARRSGLVNPVAIVTGNVIALVAEGGPGGVPETLSELARYLPRSALPASIHFVPSHPRTVNGKLDRRAIQAALGDADGR
jgi:D-alanine--poly(phosphoribitol) ligase subunit 1